MSHEYLALLYDAVEAELSEVFVEGVLLCIFWTAVGKVLFKYVNLKQL